MGVYFVFCLNKLCQMQIITQYVYKVCSKVIMYLSRKVMQLCLVTINYIWLLHGNFKQRINLEELFSQLFYISLQNNYIVYQIYTWRASISYIVYTL